MDEKFRYTYSAKTHDEVAQIREKYEMPAPVGKLDQLRALDKSCERPGTIAAVIVGVIGTLMMGGGMALIMETSLFVPGIVLGVIGLGSWRLRCRCSAWSRRADAARSLRRSCG